MSEPILIVSTGLANVASVAAGLRRAGATTEITTDPERVARARGVVLPGVGAFAAGMRSLREHGLDDVLRERFRDGRPTLGVCLGMQLLFATSDESPGVRGLGVFDGHVGSFPPDMRVPQMGWNSVAVDADNPFLRSGTAYFANSFRATEIPAGWTGAWTTYGDRFVAALTRGDALTCQFHPELSGAWGLALLERWVGSATGRTIASPEFTPAPPPTGKACRVIPCLDVKEGRVVKGIRFQGLRDAGDAVEQSANYEIQGADEVVVLDVAATNENRANRAELVAQVRERLSVPLTVGGGIRSVEDARVLLGAGADKVSMNTAAVLRPELLTEVADELGRQCTVLALDAARRDDGSWEIVIRAGTERTGIDAVAFAEKAVALGAGEILLTSWDRDGTGSGYDLELIRAIAHVANVPIIASGGAADAEHMAAALEAGADAVLAATIFHDGHTTVGEVKAALARLGARIRPQAPAPTGTLAAEGAR